MVNLDGRLQMAADMVRPGRVVCDIGTDHAYLPVYLVQNGIVPSAYAGDLREGPLENARNTVSKCELSDKITLILSAGLTKFDGYNLHDFVIAGMGGNLIADILSESPWALEAGNHFVLQPQSHAEDLREYLYNSGFKILRENVIRDGRHLYVCMEAEFIGHPDKKPEIPFYKYYVGEMTSSESPFAKEYLEYVISRLETRHDALVKSELNTVEVGVLEDIIKKIRAEIKANF